MVFNVSSSVGRFSSTNTPCSMLSRCSRDSVMNSRSNSPSPAMSKFKGPLPVSTGAATGAPAGVAGAGAGAAGVNVAAAKAAAAAAAAATNSAEMDTNPPPPRIVTHEGVVHSVTSIIAPTYYELDDATSGKAINYLFTTSTNLDLSKYNKLHIIVTGEETLVQRWKNTPMLTIQRIQVVE